MKNITPLFCVLALLIFGCSDLNKDLPENILTDEYLHQYEVTVEIEGGENNLVIWQDSSVISDLSGDGPQLTNDPSLVTSGSNSTFSFAANEGYEIVGITIDDIFYEDSASFSYINMGNNSTIKFHIEPFKPIITFEAIGSDSPVLFNYGGITLTEQTFHANYGMNFSLTVQDQDGYQIDSILVDGVLSPTSPTISVVDIKANSSVTVYYSEVEDTYYDITITIDSGDGTPVSSTQKVLSGTDTLLNWSELIAGYSVTSVTVNTVTDAAITQKQLLIDKPYTIVVTVELLGSDLVTITSTTEGKGSVTPVNAPETPNVYSKGSTPQFTITPDEHYELTELLIDNAAVDSTTSYTFASLEANHTIDAKFSAITHTISISSGANGHCEIDTEMTMGDVVVTDGDSLTLSIVADTDYRIASVTINSVAEEAPFESQYRLDSIITSGSFEVTFEKIPVIKDIHTVTITSGANGYCEIEGAVKSGDVQVTDGDSLKVSIFADTDYRIASVSINSVAQVAPFSSLYSLDSVTENGTFEVTFDQVPLGKVSVTGTNSLGGTITPEGQTSVTIGTDVIFKIRPSEYYTLDELQINGGDVVIPITSSQLVNSGDTLYTYTVSEIQEALTVEPIFSTEYKRVALSAQGEYAQFKVKGAVVDSLWIHRDSGATITVDSDIANWYYLESYSLHGDTTASATDIVKSSYDIVIDNFRKVDSVYAQCYQYYSIVPSMVEGNATFGYVSGNDTIDFIDSLQVRRGVNKVIVFTPSAGHHINSIEINSVENSATYGNNPYGKLFSGTIDGNFVPLFDIKLWVVKSNFSVKAIVTGSGVGGYGNGHIGFQDSVSSTLSTIDTVIRYGEPLTIFCNPAQYFEASTIQNGTKGNIVGNKYSIDNIVGDSIFYISFDNIQDTIKITVPGGNGGVRGDTYEDTVTSRTDPIDRVTGSQQIIFTADAGFEIDQVIITGGTFDSSSAASSMTISKVTGDLDVVVSYKEITNWVDIIPSLGLSAWSTNTMGSNGNSSKSLVSGGLRFDMTVSDTSTFVPIPKVYTTGTFSANQPTSLTKLDTVIVCYRVLSANANIDVVVFSLGQFYSNGNFDSNFGVNLESGFASKGIVVTDTFTINDFATQPSSPLGSITLGSTEGTSYRESIEQIMVEPKLKKFDDATHTVQFEIYDIIFKGQEGLTADLNLKDQ